MPRLRPIFRNGLPTNRKLPFKTLAWSADGQSLNRMPASTATPIKGTVANGRFGPDLTHLMSRDTIAAGALPNTRANLEKWIKNPDAYKPGCLMPAMKLSDQDVDQDRVLSCNAALTG